MKKRLLFLISALLFASLSIHAQTIALPETTPKLQEKWKRFHKKTARGLDDFISEHLTPITKEIKAVFYPFGGPDLTYPMLFFPTASQIVILGLEFPGKAENAGQITVDNSFEQVESLLTRSFFITSQMCKHLTKNTGVMAPLFLQLKLLGVQDVTVSEPDLPYSGIKIMFQHQGQEKSIHYYRMDLNDERNPQPFLEHIKDHYHFDGCLIKSSSYIPHQRNFKIIRDFITTHANLIVQDDSGVPIKHLKEKFDVHVYGQYLGPYGKEFTSYKQKDLPSGEKKLSFCFGYGCGRQHSFVMIAHKKPTPEDSPSSLDPVTP